MGQRKALTVALFATPAVVLGLLSCVLMALLYSVSFTASPHGIPRESIIPTRENLGTWEPYLTPYSSVTTAGDEMYLEIPESAWEKEPLDDPDGPFYWQVGAWTYRGDYADFSASVDVRAIDTDPYASACLMVRSDPEGGPELTADPDSWQDFDEISGYSFNLCLSEEYGLHAWWSDASGDVIDGEYLSDWVYLWGEDVDAALNPLDEWNRLKIIARGETIWMFVNDQYAGVTRFSGPADGAIGVRLDVERDGHGSFAFRRLEIRGLGWI